eukprot:TRINITY_DN11710_c0_g3_i1.p2 TRINITY_DN11710_c0_g3~~TRINITY_DN11710_c0_g3_i1.p2  ORF type:complete len:103 (+),score=8.56 TRINITY_DN11710_c0_g3_i1:47-310(+)
MSERIRIPFERTKLLNESIAWSSTIHFLFIDWNSIFLGFVSAYFSHVPYNTIVQALNSITALETQAWFTTSAKVANRMGHLAGCNHH